MAIMEVHSDNGWGKWLNYALLEDHICSANTTGYQCWIHWICRVCGHTVTECSISYRTIDVFTVVCYFTIYICISWREGGGGGSKLNSCRNWSTKYRVSWKIEVKRSNQSQGGGGDGDLWAYIHWPILGVTPPPPPNMYAPLPSLHTVVT